MRPLFIGIYNYFVANNASDFYTAIGGRLYFMEAPAGATKPYAVYHWIGSEPVENYFKEEFEDIEIQLSLWDDGTGATSEKSPDRVLQIAEYGKTLFDMCFPTVTGWSVIDFRRIAYQGGSLVDMEQGDFLVPLCYKIKLQRQWR